MRKLLGISPVMNGQELFDAVSSRLGSLTGSSWTLYVQASRKFQMVSDKSRTRLI